MADAEVNIQEAAELLGVSREKVRRMIKAGLLSTRTSVLNKRERRIPRAAVERILAEEEAARSGSPDRAGETPTAQTV